MTTREIAERTLILKALVGSNAHGLALPGKEDTDEMGVYIEPPQFVIGMRTMEHVIARTQPEGHPSGFGDVDLSMYSLRKFCRLAMSGNPTILMLLFCPEPLMLQTDIGVQLQQDVTQMLLSKRAAAAYKGYMTAQRQRMTGERGGRALRKHYEGAYDTKYAMHMLRLGVQGVELLTTGRITLPVPEPARSRLMAVRREEVDINDVLSWAGQLEEQVEDAAGLSLLPDEPDAEGVDDWLVRTYQNEWDRRLVEGHRDYTLRLTEAV